MHFNFCSFDTRLVSSSFVFLDHLKEIRHDWIFKKKSHVAPDLKSLSASTWFLKYFAFCIGYRWLTFDTSFSYRRLSVINNPTSQRINGVWVALNDIFEPTRCKSITFARNFVISLRHSLFRKVKITYDKIALDSVASSCTRACVEFCIPRQSCANNKKKGLTCELHRNFIFLQTCAKLYIVTIYVCTLQHISEMQRRNTHVWLMMDFKTVG